MYSMHGRIVNDQTGAWNSSQQPNRPVFFFNDDASTNDTLHVCYYYFIYMLLFPILSIQLWSIVCCEQPVSLVNGIINGTDSVFCGIAREAIHSLTHEHDNGNTGCFLFCESTKFADESALSTSRLKITTCRCTRICLFFF